MKNLILSFLLVFSISPIEAQVKTGGGGGPDLETKDQRLEKYETYHKLRILFAELNAALIKIEGKCMGRKSVPAKYNFIDSFYSFTMKNANSPLVEADCKPSNKVAQCLKNKELKEIMLQIYTHTPHLFTFLEQEYKLDQKTAGVIMMFYYKQ